MRFVIAETLGIFLVVVGCALGVGAAALVSTALACAVAAALLVLAGVLTVYVAAVYDARARAAAEPTRVAR